MNKGAIAYRGHFSLVPPGTNTVLSSIISTDTEQYNNSDNVGGWSPDGTAYTFPVPIVDFTSTQLTTVFSSVWLNYVVGVISEHALELEHTVGAGTKSIAILDRPYTRADLLTTLNAATAAISVVWTYTTEMVGDVLRYRLTATNNNASSVTLGGSFFTKGGSGHGLYGTSAVTIATTDAYVFPIGDYVQSHFYYVNLTGTIGGQSYGSCGNHCIATVYAQGGNITDGLYSISPAYSLVTGSKTNWKLHLTDERGDSVTNFNFGALPQVNLHVLQQFIEHKGPEGAVKTPATEPVQRIRAVEGRIEPTSKRRRMGKNLYSHPNSTAQ